MRQRFLRPSQSVIHSDPSARLPAVHVIQDLVRPGETVEEIAIHARVKGRSNNTRLEARRKLRNSAAVPQRWHPGRRQNDEHIRVGGQQVLKKGRVFKEGVTDALGSKVEPSTWVTPNVLVVQYTVEVG